MTPSSRSSGRSPGRSLGCSAVALALLPLILWVGAQPAEREGSPTIARGDALDPAIAPPIAACPQADADLEDTAGDPLVGVWHRFPAHSEGDVVRFYYFHGDGHGLYRYGKVGLTNTHAFDYEVVGDRARLRFRKTGEVREVAFVIDDDPEIPQRQWLTMIGDPREDSDTRYFRDPPTQRALGACEGAAPAGDGIGNRLWIDQRAHAAGGLGFAIYQLQPQTIDGRGVGWFHRGDYDEWTTEALTYRRQGDVLTLHFMLSGESVTTSIAVERRGDERTLAIDLDPRDFWHGHRYRDGGPSFAGAAADEALPWRCLPQ